MVLGLEAELELGHEGRVQLAQDISLVLHDRLPLALQNELLVHQLQGVELPAPVVPRQVDQAEATRAQATHQLEMV